MCRYHDYMKKMSKIATVNFFRRRGFCFFVRRLDESENLFLFQKLCRASLRRTVSAFCGGFPSVSVKNIVGAKKFFLCRKCFFHSLFLSPFLTDEFFESFPICRKVLSLIASKEEKVAAFLQLFSENRKIFAFLPKSAKIHAESEHTESGLQKMFVSL